MKLHLGSNPIMAAHRAAVLAWLIFFSCGIVVAQGDRAQGEHESPQEGARKPGEAVWVPKSRLTDGPHVRFAFREIVSTPSEATVRVHADGMCVALGGVVGQEGWVLTKASSLRGRITCHWGDGREMEARVVGMEREHDLAMLKVETKELTVLALKRDIPVEVGQWVATVGTDSDPVAVGIVSVASRRIPPRPGILGVQLDETELGPRVVRVFASTGAEEAGVLINDVITSINGEVTSTRSQLQRVVRRHSPGDEIEVVLLRGNKRMTVRAVLTGRLPEDRHDRDEYQNSLGGELSQRRFGFPAAFQHDTVLKPNDCGGPLVDLEGNVVGFNIARAGRTESYAIPSQVLVSLLYELMSGNLSPRVAPQPVEEAAND